MGLLFGILRMPQKSLVYKRMGLTNVLNSFMVIWGNFRNLSPSFIFNFINALSALSFRSFRPDWISPDGDILNHRYFATLVLFCAMSIFLLGETLSFRLEIDVEC